MNCLMGPYLIFAAGSDKDPQQPLTTLPTAFPVFLWLPFVRPGSFCCLDADQQRAFSALLGDCIRHLNQGRCPRPRHRGLCMSDGSAGHRQ